MSEPVRPASPIAASRAVGRGQALVVRSPQPGEPAPEPQAQARTRSATPPPPGAVGAQLLGERQRRGLRAGPEVLEQARSTYLQNEFSGGRDRRPRKGLITRTEV